MGGFGENPIFGDPSGLEPVPLARILASWERLMKVYESEEGATYL